MGGMCPGLTHQNQTEFEQLRGPEQSSNMLLSIQAFQPNHSSNPNISDQQRKYINKNQLKQNYMMLMLASSAKRESLNRHMEERFNPLNGVNYDIDFFFHKFKGQGHIYHLIETSHDEGMILSKQSILGALKKYFRKPVLNIYLFYSGHGDQDLRYRGDMVLESQLGKQARQNQPWKYCISLEDIVKLWEQNKLCLQSHLYIFMDSCFSGDWCRRLSQMDVTKISIFTACNSSQYAYGLKGGFFIKTIFGDESQFETNFGLLVKEQNPIFITNSKKCAKLTKNHLKILQMDIKNAEKFNSQNELIQLKIFSKKMLQKSKQKEQIKKLKQEKLKIQIQLNKLKKEKQQLSEKQNPKVELKIQQEEIQEKQNQSENIQKLAEQFVDPKCLHFERMVLNGNTITAKSLAIIFGKNKLIGESSFTVKFIKIGFVVSFGVIDIRNRDRDRWNDNRAYYSSGGYCYVSGQNVNKGWFKLSTSGFKVGETITVTLDPNYGSIQWTVDSEVRHKAQVLMLKDESVTWVPFICLDNKDDCVEIVDIGE